MTGPVARPGRAAARVRWGLAALALAGAAAVLVPPPAGSAGAAVAATGGTPPAPVLLPGPPAPAGATPVHVDVPAIGVRSDLARLGVDAGGALVPPADDAVAGWFAAGPVPGDVGPAVLAGHVDSARGPAVFARLGELGPGDVVQVTRSDGRGIAFEVTRVARYPKSRFPTAAVYGPTTGPELRLITCGGTFDTERRSYRDNVVVFARPAR